MCICCIIACVRTCTCVNAYYMFELESDLHEYICAPREMNFIYSGNEIPSNTLPDLHRVYVN
jgi:hypothetical protein